jgi:hypothetical protein
MVAALSPTDGAGASGWALRSVPPPLLPGGGHLASVSCVDRSFCVGVGSVVVAAGTRVTLAERWNGRRWSLQSTPSPSRAMQAQLSGVSCTSRRLCIAVGAATGPSGREAPLAEHWNGRTWKIKGIAAVPRSRGGSLASVSCVLDNLCFAVGSFSGAAAVRTLSEQWNGRSWNRNAMPSTGARTSALNGVSCTLFGCMAVGEKTTGGRRAALAEFWNGLNWTISPARTPRGASATSFSGVSCSSVCVAVGGATFRGGSHPLAERFTPVTPADWVIEATPSLPGGVLTAVSCASDCTAVGSFRSGSRRTVLAMRSGPRGFRLSKIANPPDQSSLNGVSCASRCMAVGDLGAGSGQRALSEEGDSSSFRLRSIASTPAVRTGALNNVSCSSATACTAVGYTVAAGGTRVALAARWNGRTWQLQRVPNLAGATHGSVLSAVSCPAMTACAAVGYFGNGSGLHTLALAWDGRAWTVQAAADRPGDTVNVLSAVSCLPTAACLAVGHSQGRAGMHTLAETGLGGRWTIQPAPDPNGAVRNTLTAVSCAFSSPAFACTAVGSTLGRPLAVRLGQTGWSLQTAATGARAQSTELDGVSCPTLTTCTAVGTIRRSTGTALLAERWDSSGWALQTAPNPSARFSELVGVSCTSPTSCTAVGSRVARTGLRPTLVEHWNGTTWSIQHTPNPAPASASSLRGVSCSAPTACLAVGDYAAAITLPLSEQFSG